MKRTPQQVFIEWFRGSNKTGSRSPAFAKSRASERVLFSPLNRDRQTVLYRLSTVAMSLLILATGRFAFAADDKVVLQPAGSSSRIILPCTVLDYTGQMITVRTRIGNNPKTYPASQVIEVQTPQTVAHQKGIRFLADNHAIEAKAALETALREETRTWVRREILALLVRCSTQTGDYTTAASRFLLLVKSDPQTRHFKLIPLAWSPITLDATALGDARAWITSTADVTRLIGASLLLDDVNYSNLAENELKQLATSTNNLVHQLAKAQLWRTELRNTEIGKNQLARWENRMKTMPKELLGGPYYLLGRGYFLRQEFDRSAAAFLWVPLVYDHDHQLAARANLHAADALSRLGQQSEATILYREVVVRFGDTSFANEAAAQLKSLQSNQQTSKKRSDTTTDN